jgi:hypothetical protein
LRAGAFFATVFFAGAFLAGAFAGAAGAGGHTPFASFGAALGVMT